MKGGISLCVNACSASFLSRKTSTSSQCFHESLFLITKHPLKLSWKTNNQSLSTLADLTLHLIPLLSPGTDSLAVENNHMEERIQKEDSIRSHRGSVEHRRRRWPLCRIHPPSPPPKKNTKTKSHVAAESRFTSSSSRLYSSARLLTAAGGGGSNRYPLLSKSTKVKWKPHESIHMTIEVLR